MNPLLNAATAPHPFLTHQLDTLTPGIVHLGLGNFHRAHQATYTAAALAVEPGPWGIIGAASRSRRVVDAMRAQDLLYTVTEISPSGTVFHIPAVHTEVLVASEETERLIGALADPRTRIISLTVTESGYTFDPETGSLDVAHPDVQSDLRLSSAPRTPLGQIVHGLRQRLRSGGAPVTILSCDNLGSNGARTRELIHEFVAALPGAEGQELQAWLGDHVSFPNSMVDRIVPATTAETRAAVRSGLGLEDAAAVPAEPFGMWIIEDDFAAGRPAWERVGATFSDQVSRYENMKLRLLNGTHSLIAYLGALSEKLTIPESVAQPHIEGAARSILRHEYLPTLELPDGVDIADYEEQLFSRWRNTALGQRTSQVGTDGSVKLPQRVTEPVLQHLGQGVMPHHLALTVAAYVACVAPPAGFEPGPQARAIQDPATDRLQALAARHPQPASLMRAVFESGQVFPAVLADQADFVNRAGDLLNVIIAHGPHAAVREAATSSSSLSPRTNP